MTGYTLNGYPYMEPTDPAGTVAEHQRLLAEKIDDERGGAATLLRRTATLAVPTGLGTTPTVVPWQVEDFDTLDAFASGAPTYCTLPPNGIYLAVAGVQWAGATNGLRVLELTLDGIVQGGSVLQPAVVNNHGNNQTVSAMFLVGSTPGLLRCQLLQSSSTANLDAQAGKTSDGSSGLWMSVQRIGAL